MQNGVDVSFVRNLYKCIYIGRQYIVRGFSPFIRHSPMHAAANSFIDENHTVGFWEN